MKKPSILELMKDGVLNVLLLYNVDEYQLRSSNNINNWLRIPEVKQAAEKDIENQLLWCHQTGKSIEHCEVPHDNLCQVISKYL